jgi:hypothetical protein
MENSIPDNWSKDDISDFIEKCRNHSFQVFAGAREDYSRLVAIDKIFREIQNNLYNTNQLAASFFFLRTHSSWLAAVSLSMSGQLPESYMVLRGSIENAVYGLYICKHPELTEIWLKRNDTPAMKKKVRDEFHFSTMLELLKTIDAIVGEVTSELYERAIDHGAHPNQFSITTALRISETETRKQFDIAYISGDSLANQVCLKTCGQVGVTVLSIFHYVFKERFEILSLDKKIDELKQFY